MEDNDSLNLLGARLAGKALLILILAGILIGLTGCDDSEFSRQVALAQYNATVARNCVPVRGDSVMVTRVGDEIICRHYSPNDRYSKNAPHVQVTTRVVEAF